MDVVESVQACVQNWETGGESEWYALIVILKLDSSLTKE